MTSRRHPALIETRPMQAVLMLVVAVGLPVAIGSAAAGRRGWVVGVACGLIFALVFGLGSWSSSRGWSRRHPLADGAILGPLTFVLTCLISPIPIWMCVLIGAVATVGGVLRGAQRRSRWQSQNGAEQQHRPDR